LNAGGIGIFFHVFMKSAKKTTLPLNLLPASSTSEVSLGPGLGVFLERPRLWDPEAEGWRILVDVNPLDDDQQNRLEDAVRGAWFRWRRTSRGRLVLLEIHVPRAQHLGN
jgi:hypothetical protein